MWDDSNISTLQIKLPGKRDRLSELHKQHSDLEITEFIIENNPSPNDPMIDTLVTDDDTNSEGGCGTPIVVKEGNGHINKNDNSNSDNGSTSDTTCTTTVDDSETADVLSCQINDPEVDMKISLDDSSSRKRLLRAKTMTCGAVLIEEEEEDEVDGARPKSQIDRSPSVEIRDADEDRLFQQMKEMQEMKTQLIGSINNDLPTVTPHDQHNNNGQGAECCGDIVNMIKPSGLRKVSSQISPIAEGVLPADDDRE